MEKLENIIDCIDSAISKSDLCMLITSIWDNGKSLESVI